MISSQRRLFAAAAFVAALVVPSMAIGGDACRAGCARETRHCIADQARAALFACKLDCAGQALADLPACTQGCVSTFRTERAACRGQHTDCTDVCEGSGQSPAHDPACTGACGNDLAACGQTVADQGRRCILDCVDFPGRLAIDCLYGCVDTAKIDAQTCGADFHGCVEDCAVTTTLP